MKLSYEEAAEHYDKALDEVMELYKSWTPTSYSDLVEYAKKGEVPPNEKAYQEERHKIIAKHLEGTGWGVEEMEEEIDERVCWDTEEETA
jgi:hypothetical protein